MTTTDQEEQTDVQEQKDVKTYEQMTGPELVEAYNAMLTTTAGIELIKQGGMYRRGKVDRFKDRETGVKRCEGLASALRAVLGFEKIEARRAAGEPEEAVNETETSTASEEEQTDMATKKNKRAAKSKKAATPKRPRLSATDGKISNRQKLKNALTERLGKAVTRHDLCKAVYGNVKEESFGALNMVLRGLKLEIEAETYPYVLKRAKNDDGEITYALNNAK